MLNIVGTYVRRSTSHGYELSHCGFNFSEQLYATDRIKFKTGDYTLQYEPDKYDYEGHFRDFSKEVIFRVTNWMTEKAIEDL